MLESAIEQRFTREARNLNCLAVKMGVVSLAGFPDRLVLCPGGRAMFFEFKQPGKKRRKLQVRIGELIESLGFVVVEADDADEAVAELKWFLSQGDAECV